MCGSTSYNIIVLQFQQTHILMSIQEEYSLKVVLVNFLFQRANFTCNVKLAVYAS